jgi:crotonobetainyl-CoA:carnitine CoA-transferase CaiB-like acyl-CoA transferase
VLTQQQALDHPQVQALGILQDTDYPGLPRAGAGGRGADLDDRNPARGRAVRPPQLGEHTDEMLGELGYSGAEIADLREQSVI